MVLAVSAIERDDTQRFRLWIVATAASGLVFISGQVYEFQPVRAARAWATRPTGSSSAFYTLTGFHGVHVTVGIIMLLSVLLLSFRGHISPSQRRDGRGRRPLLALRRRRVDPHLHRRLPDPLDRGADAWLPPLRSLITSPADDVDHDAHRQRTYVISRADPRRHHRHRGRAHVLVPRRSAASRAVAHDRSCWRLMADQVRHRHRGSSCTSSSTSACSRSCSTPAWSSPSLVYIAVLTIFRFWAPPATSCRSSGVARRGREPLRASLLGRLRRSHLPGRPSKMLDPGREGTRSFPSPALPS